MGIILSRFRKKKSTIEVLEQLEQEITKLQQFRRRNQERQKKFIATLLLYSILSYIVLALVFYFYYFPDKWKDRLLYSIPLLLFPLIIWLIKKVLHWYFVKRIAGNDLELQDLRDKKEQMLEDVMEKETYNKAKEILKKFDPARFKELETPKPATPPKTSPGTEIRQRQIPQSATQPTPQRPQIRPGMIPGATPMRPGMTPGPTPMRPGMTPGSTPMRPQQGPRPVMTPYGPAGTPRQLLHTPHTNGGYGTPQGPPLPRPILPRERGTMDRLLEYLVGDGPQNQFALICGNCHSHNGMALKEEFEYVEFRCCYCYAMNPARRKRPYAPRIERPVPPPRLQMDSQGDESESDEVEDDDGEETMENSNEEEADNNKDGSQSDDGSHDRHEESMEVETTGSQGAGASVQEAGKQPVIPNVLGTKQKGPNEQEAGGDIPNEQEVEQKDVPN